MTSLRLFDKLKARTPGSGPFNRLRALRQAQGTYAGLRARMTSSRPFNKLRGREAAAVLVVQGPAQERNSCPQPGGKPAAWNAEGERGPFLSRPLDHQHRDPPMSEHTGKKLCREGESNPYVLSDRRV